MPRSTIASTADEVRALVRSSLRVLERIDPSKKGMDTIACRTEAGNDLFQRDPPARPKAFEAFKASG
jgi:hypothetical protein